MVIGLVVNSSHATATLYVLHLVTQKNLRHTYQLQKKSTTLNSFKKNVYVSQFIQNFLRHSIHSKNVYVSQFIQNFLRHSIHSKKCLRVSIHSKLSTTLHSFTTILRVGVRTYLDDVNTDTCFVKKLSILTGTSDNAYY